MMFDDRPPILTWSLLYLCAVMYTGAVRDSRAEEFTEGHVMLGVVN